MKQVIKAGDLEVGDRIVGSKRSLTVESIQVTREGWTEGNALLHVRTYERGVDIFVFREASDVEVDR